MRYILSETTDPYFNIATEEFILRNIDDDVFYLYRNAPSIIIGKNQNTLSEINYDYIVAHDIPVVRRQSGGGAVFHDLGNLNFCFITKYSTKTDVSFESFTLPILEVLRDLGIDAQFTGRNDLSIDGKKISGNAQFHFKNRILHHGTLLFSSNITDLSAALKVKPYKLKKKGIKSVGSRVTNISSHLVAPLTIEQFIQHITDHMKDSERIQDKYTLSTADQAKIAKLVHDKYGTWDWNYGKSPKFSIEKVLSFSGGNIEYHLDVTKCIISSLKIYGDFFGKKDPAEIELALIGVPHQKESIEQALHNISIQEYFAKITLTEFIEGLF